MSRVFVFVIIACFVLMTLRRWVPYWRRRHQQHRGLDPLKWTIYIAATLYVIALVYHLWHPYRPLSLL